MLSCKEATRLTEQKLFEGKLGWFKEKQLAMHLKICDACSRYARQSKSIENAFRNRLESDQEMPESQSGTDLPSLSTEAKNAILKKLERPS